MITNERLKRLERLLEVVRMVSADLDDFTVLQSIISVASELTQSEVASILRYEEEDGCLYFVAAPWFHRDNIENVCVPLGESIAGWVFTHGKTLVIQDVKADERFYSEVDEAAEFQTKSILAVPLLFNGEPVGVFEAINKTNLAHYNGEDVTILETLASLTALIVRNHSLKDEIKKTKQESEQLKQMKKDFIAISSHELRTPLGLILGHATFLREVIEDEHHEQMDTIINSGAKLKEIVENMANVDNYQSGAASLRMRKISINNLIKNIVTVHQEMANTKNITLRVDIKEPNLLLEGDANKIEIVVDNLLKNAITFTSTGGHVFIVAERVPGYIKVSVIDDGIGIQPKELKHIFERFYQVQSHLTRQHGGMGLGLSVAKVMVEMHGGEIWAESIPEKGSRFSFRLPINPKQISAAQSLFDDKMTPHLLFLGRLDREYILPMEGAPILDRPGGSPLYAAGAATLWAQEIGLVARVGEDYPNAWLRDFAARGIDIKGVQIVPGTLDLRSFRAYEPNRELSRSNPVGHFASRELTFPKALLGYRPPERKEKIQAERPASSPRVNEIPKAYLEANAAHIAPLDFLTQGQLLTALRAAGLPIISLDPEPEYMYPHRRQDLRLFLDGLTAFLPSEEEMRSLFWGETHDLWAMAEELGNFGCRFILIKRGKDGQLLYDSAAKKRWELPAYSSRVADPTGAGDAFCGGFLAGFQEHQNPLHAAAYGNVSASLSMEGSGPFYPLEVLPRLAQARLDAMLDMVREV